MILAEIFFVGSLCVLLVAYLPRVAGILLGTALWLNAVGFIIFFWMIYAFADAAARHGLTRGWTLLVVRILVVDVLSALMALTQRIDKAVWTNIHLLPTYSGNQSLGRFLWHAVVTIPLGYWILAGGRFGTLERLGIATLIGIGAAPRFPSTLEPSRRCAGSAD